MPRKRNTRQTAIARSAKRRGRKSRGGRASQPKPAGLFRKGSIQGKKVVRYSHPGRPGLFNRKVRGSKKVVFHTRPRVHGKKAPKVASDVVSTKQWRQLGKLDPEQLRFRKKGKKLGVYDTKGRKVAELPYRKGMDREVKARLRLAGGERRVRDIKRVRLSPGKDWKLLKHIPTHGDMTIWLNEVYRSRRGVPIGQPKGTPASFWGKEGIARTGKELWSAFEAIEPLKWERIAANVPDWFREKGGAVGVVLKVMDAEGRIHIVSTGMGWQLESMTDPSRGHLFLSEMLAAALSLAGRRFGYGGATLALSVSLEIGVRRPGAPIPVTYGRPVEDDEDEDYEGDEDVEE